MLTYAVVAYVILCVLSISMYVLLIWWLFYRDNRSIRAENPTSVLSPAALRYLYIGVVDDVSAKANLLDLRNRGFIDDENRPVDASYDPPFEDEKAMLKVLKDPPPRHLLLQSLKRRLELTLIEKYENMRAKAKTLNTMLLMAVDSVLIIGFCAVACLWLISPPPAGDNEWYIVFPTLSLTVASGISALMFLKVLNRVSPLTEEGRRILGFVKYVQETDTREVKPYIKALEPPQS